MIKFMMVKLLFSQEVPGKGSDSSWGLDGAAVKRPGPTAPCPELYTGQKSELSLGCLR